MKKTEVIQSDHEIFNLLLIKLYTRELNSGEKLPPLRALAKELGVNQASLRIALKQLEMMNLLDIRRSDGVYVKDFKESGGLEFLTNLFSIKEIQGKESILDSFLVDEIMGFWIAMFPEIMFMAGKKYSSLDLKQIIEILDLQIENVDNIEKLIELDILSQKLIGKLANNLVVSLFLNSMGPFTQKMTAVFYQILKKESRLRFLQVKREGAFHLMNETLDLRNSTEGFRQEMEKCRKEIRNSTSGSMLHSRT